MGDERALRPAGRSGGEDQVRRVARRRHFSEPFGRLPFDRDEVTIEHDGPRHRSERRLRATRSSVTMAADPRVVQRERDPRRRIRGIDRDVRRARLEDPEHARHHRRRSPDTQPDPFAPTDAEASQVPRQLVRARVEIGVGDRPLGVLHRRRGRRSSRLVLEETLDTNIARDVGPRVVPVDEQATSLLVGQERQLRDAGLRLRHGALEQARVLRDHALDRRSIEEVGGVLPREHEPFRALLRAHRELEIRDARVEIEDLPRPPRRAGERRPACSAGRRRPGRSACDSDRAPARRAPPPGRRGDPGSRRRRGRLREPGPGAP